MELLTIRHQDFEMIVECTKFDDIWRKAKNNVGEEGLHSTYSWSEGVASVTLSNHIGERVAIEDNQQAPAVFFDNVDYPIWIEFKDYVKKAQFGSILQNENEKFTFRRQILAGFLNYSNEVGRSEIQFIYQVGAETREFVFSFEVLSTKLNYHEHWRTIIEDIEQEYRMLSLDYMRRTFHGFSPDTNGETPEIIWWSVFANEQQKFIKACKNIIDRPRHRLHGKDAYKRADKLTFIPSYIENELAEHRNDCAHLYRVEEHVWTNDTQENRFLKFALGQIADKYEVLKKHIEAVKNASDVMKDDMQATLTALKHLQRNSFFRTVGNYKGMNQESLVLQKATGYSQVYRTWNLLQRSYSLNDGIYRLQTKDIATLYEIWCFIEVSHIVKEKLHLSNEDIDHRNRMEMNGLFTWDLGKGEHSRILFKKDDVELVLNKIESTDSDYLTKIQLLMQDDSQCGDLVYEDTFQLTSDAAAGYLANLDDYLADYDAWNDGKSYVEATKAATYYDGSYYGIPSCTDSRGLVVNTEVLEEAGLGADWQPASWDELLDGCRQIKEKCEDVIPFWMILGKANGEAASMNGYEMILYGTEDGNDSHV